jgi:hypothetical protein
MSGGEVHIVSKRNPVNDEIADAFVKVSNVLREYTGERKRIEVPASGNDKKIFENVKRDLNLSSDSSFAQVFEAYSKYLRKMEEKELSQELSTIKGKYSSPSIFKPELYSLIRGPFQNKQLDSDHIGFDIQKHALGSFLIRLGGYVVSRVGKINASPLREKPVYLTTLVMPAEVQNLTDSDFDKSLRVLRQKNIPGFYPEEALIMWLAASLPPNSPDILVVGMQDPGGQSAAKIDVGMHIPLNSYRSRAEEFLGECRKRNLIDLFRDLIPSAMRDDQSTVSANILRLLFRASQKDSKTAEELLLRASKIVIGNSELKTKKEYIETSKKVLRLAFPLLHST